MHRDQICLNAADLDNITGRPVGGIIPQKQQDVKGRLRQFQFFTQGLAHFPIRQRKLFDGFQSRIQSSFLIYFYFESFNIEVL